MYKTGKDINDSSQGEEKCDSVKPLKVEFYCIKNFFVILGFKMSHLYPSFCYAIFAEQRVFLLICQLASISKFPCGLPTYH